MYPFSSVNGVPHGLLFADVMMVKPVSSQEAWPEIEAMVLPRKVPIAMVAVVVRVRVVIAARVVRGKCMVAAWFAVRLWFGWGKTVFGVLSCKSEEMVLCSIDRWSEMRRPYIPLSANVSLAHSRS